MNKGAGISPHRDAGAWGIVFGHAVVLAALLLGEDGRRWLIWPATVQIVVRYPLAMWRMAVMQRGEA
jgi:hypothetical protein